MSRDVLFVTLDYIKRQELEQKKSDVQDSAKATFISGTLTGLTLYLGASIPCIATLALITLTVYSCWNNEAKRLAIMGTLPLHDDNNSPSASPIQRTRRHRHTLALTSPQVSNDNNSPTSSSFGSPRSALITRRIAFSAPPTPRH